jgi:hypothetical protein
VRGLGHEQEVQEVRSRHVLQAFKLENLTVRKREVGCSPVIREFEFVFLTVGNPYRNGRRERISTSEAMIYQWASLSFCFEVEKVNVSRPYITYSKKSILRSNLSFYGLFFVDKLLTVYITKCNGQRFRLYIREGILCGVGGNLCKR